MVDEILNEKFEPGGENAGNVIVLRYCAKDLKNRVPVFVAKFKSDLKCLVDEQSLKSLSDFTKQRLRKGQAEADQEDCVLEIIGYLVHLQFLKKYLVIHIANFCDMEP